MKTFTVNGDLEFIGSDYEAEASISLNPNFKWCRVIVTDDKPNANNHRIPNTEFSNLIKSGVNAPIKMARGVISDGHAEAWGNPIGVLAKLKGEDDKVIALGALWPDERPEDIKLLEEMSAKGNNPKVSWEISYKDEIENGKFKDLTGVSLNGLAIVGEPAYEERTQITAIAEKEKEKLDELEKLKSKLDEANGQLAEANSKIEELKSEAKEKEDKYNEELQELEELREFKAEIDSAKEKAEKLAAIKTKFEEAGLEKDSDYFEKNAEMLLSLDDNALEFILQEMVAFATREKDEDKKKDSGVDIPNLKADSGQEYTAKEIGEGLRGLHVKKE